MKSLVIAVGNPYRRDDGVGRHIVDVLRRRLGRAPLDPYDDGYDDLGHELDTIVLHQIVPELAETIKDYERVVFVDAHVPTLGDSLREERLEPEYDATRMISHHYKPSTVLALTQRFHGAAPEALLLSLPGYDFDFGEGLSPAVAEMLPQVVARIISWTIETPTSSAGSS